ncbi:hypothetical protein D3C73_1453640 [compost metagenome]
MPVDQFCENLQTTRFRIPKPLSFRGLTGLGTVLQQLFQGYASSSRAKPLCNSPPVSLPPVPFPLGNEQSRNTEPMTLINAPPSDTNQ